MPKMFKNFTFCGKKLSALNTKYISVDFDASDEFPLGLEREMVSGETNRYRTEANYFYDQWSDTLKFELHIAKNDKVYGTQEEMEITENEIREITGWLTSSHFPEKLTFEYDDANKSDATNYYGWFSNIESFAFSGVVYGLKLYFTCTTPFGYTDEFVHETTVSSYGNLTIENNSDEINSYCYPTLEIYPNANGQIFICNTTDCKVLETGTLSLTQSTYFDSLLGVINNYAKLKGYDVEYAFPAGEDSSPIPLCDNTAVQFYLVGKFGERVKCTAYFVNDTKKYSIINGGFMYLSVYKSLKVFVDFQRLLIYDELDRMITYDKLGISDVDHLYWLRLLNGTNNLLLYGKCKFTFKHIESRKVG